MKALRKVAGVLLMGLGLWNLWVVYDVATAKGPAGDDVAAARPGGVSHLIEGALIFGFGVGSIWAGVWLAFSRPRPPDTGG